jgi:hypothetical protein
LKLSGDYTVLFSFADPKTDSCAKISGTGASGYVIPLPTFKGARRFVWTASVREYGGPGTYDLRDLEVFKVTISKTAAADPIDYVAAEDATAQLDVSGENAGSLTFDGLTDQDGDEISGRASWSCTEGSEGSG